MDNSIDDYRILTEKFISFGSDGHKILYVVNSNFKTIFKKQDYYAHLNYTNAVRYFLYNFLYTYSGKDDTILKVNDLLKNNSTSKKLNVLNYIISDPYLYKYVVKKYYPYDDEFCLTSKNLNLINHIYVHKDKIFCEENVIKLIKRAIKHVASEENDDVIDFVNAGVAGGVKAVAPTLHEKNCGVDMWLITPKGSKHPVKCIYLNPKSEYNVVIMNGIVKFILYEVKSDMGNFQSGINTMKCKYIAILDKDKGNLIFISTDCVDEISNRKLDKQIAIQFNPSKIPTIESVNAHIKEFKIKN